MPFQHLLVATDLSPAANAVHRHAADLAQALGARVTLLNVDETSNFNFAVRTPATHHRFAQLLRDASRQRALALEDARSGFDELGVPLEVEAVVGKPVEVIQERALATGADLLVVGRRGARGLRRRRLGHTTKRVLRRIALPTLVVPETPAPGGTEDGAVYRSILAATNLTATCSLGLLASLALARALEAEVTYGHVCRLPVPFFAAEIGWPDVVPNESREELEQTLLEELRALAGEAGAPRTAVATVLDVGVAEGLARMAQEAGAGLITIPASERGATLFGGTSDSVVRASTVPVLVYPLDHLQQRWT